MSRKIIKPPELILKIQSFCIKDNFSNQFTRSYPPLLSSTRSYPPLLSSTRSFLPILSSTRSYPPILSSTRSYSPLLSSTGFYSPLLSSIRSYPSLLSSTHITFYTYWWVSVSRYSSSGLKLVSRSFFFLALLGLVNLETKGIQGSWSDK